MDEKKFKKLFNEAAKQDQSKTRDSIERKQESFKVNDYITLRRRKLITFIYINEGLVIDFKMSDKDFEEFCLNMKSWSDSNYSNNAIPSDIAFTLLDKLGAISAAKQHFVEMIKRIDLYRLKQILSKGNIVNLDFLSRDFWHSILLELYESMDIERILVLISGYKSYKNVDLSKLLINPAIKSMLFKTDSNFYKKTEILINNTINSSNFPNIYLEIFPALYDIFYHSSLKDYNAIMKKILETPNYSKFTDNQKMEFTNFVLEADYKQYNHFLYPRLKHRILQILFEHDRIEVLTVLNDIAFDEGYENLDFDHNYIDSKISYNNLFERIVKKGNVKKLFKSRILSKLKTTDLHFMINHNLLSHLGTFWFEFNENWIELDPYERYDDYKTFEKAEKYRNQFKTIANRISSDIMKVTIKNSFYANDRDAIFLIQEMGWFNLYTTREKQEFKDVLKLRIIANLLQNLDHFYLRDYEDDVEYIYIIPKTLYQLNSFMDYLNKNDLEKLCDTYNYEFKTIKQILQNSVNYYRELYEKSFLFLIKLFYRLYQENLNEKALNIVNELRDVIELRGFRWSLSKISVQTAVYYKILKEKEEGDVESFHEFIVYYLESTFKNQKKVKDDDQSIKNVRL